MATTPNHLKPRKSPRQQRAAVTVDAIFEATVQVLLTDGAPRLTTTRVADRAGVSVGTMYQYFPHKQALIYGLTERHLDHLTKRIEAVCAASCGQPVDAMVTSIIDTYWDAKLERPGVTRALYLAPVEVDNQGLIEAFALRVEAATSSMFASSAELDPDCIASVNRTLISVILGAVRIAFEHNQTPEDLDSLREQIRIMCCAYLRTVTEIR